jgi:NodT family efflux transporter outer membrane factor (OMF) lipoprotein
MAHNQSLAASNATLEQARQQVAAVAGGTLPQVDANARVEREEANLAAFGFDPAEFGIVGGNPIFNLYTVGGGVSYDLDLFGGRKRSVEQAAARAEGQLRQTEAAHLIVAGRVVSQVLAIAAIRTRIATTSALLEEDQRMVELTEARRRAGAGTLVEVLNAQSQLANDRGDLPPLEQQLAEARNMLAILVGTPPAELEATDFDLDSFMVPASIPVTIPSLLVHKRPDILQAEADLHAATAGLGVATARLYPDITLGATLTQGAPNIGDVLDAGFRGFDIFAGLGGGAVAGIARPRFVRRDVGFLAGRCGRFEIGARNATAKGKGGSKRDRKELGHGYSMCRPRSSSSGLRRAGRMKTIIGTIASVTTKRAQKAST